MKIKKAVIPIAGKGTRFLPATKEIPKEILPILNIPMIYYVVQEAVNSGIEEIIFVTSSGKESIENLFDRNLELEDFLKRNNKEELAKEIRAIGEMVNVVTVRQKEQLGLGHAVLQAESIISDDYFACLLGDDLIFNDPPVTQQLIQCAEKNKGSVIGVMEVPVEDVNKYGIIAGKPLGGDSSTWTMNKMVEKPSSADAPSRLATPGRYILSKNIFKALKEITPGAGGEYQLTDAINLLCIQENVFAHCFEGERYDTGTLPGYFEATLELAMRRADFAPKAKSIIQKMTKKWNL